MRLSKGNQRVNIRWKNNYDIITRINKAYSGMSKRHKANSVPYIGALRPGGIHDRGENGRGAVHKRINGGASLWRPSAMKATWNA